MEVDLPLPLSHILAYTKIYILMNASLVFNF